jgi:hypothetical protein
MTANQPQRNGQDKEAPIDRQKRGKERRLLFGLIRWPSENKIDSRGNFERLKGGLFILPILTQKNGKKNPRGFIPGEGLLDR